VQEDLTNSTIAVGEKVVSASVRAVEFTASTLAKLLLALLGFNNKNNQTVQKVDDSKVAKGKQSIKDLMSQGDELSEVEINQTGLKDFKSTARKYGITYSLVKNNSENPPKWTVFFKGKDAEVMNAAFREFTGKEMAKMEKSEKKIKSLEKKQEDREEQLTRAETAYDWAAKELEDAISARDANVEVIERHRDALNVFNEADAELDAAMRDEVKAETVLASAERQLEIAEPENIEAARESVAEAERGLYDARERVATARATRQDARTSFEAAQDNLQELQSNVDVARESLDRADKARTEALKNRDKAADKLQESKETQKPKEKEGVMQKLEKAKAKAKEKIKENGQEKNLKKSDRSR
jgi:hypothetical protein